MSDNPENRPASGGGGAPDPHVQELAAKHNISLEEAARLIDEHGVDRGKVDAQAEATKSQD